MVPMAAAALKRLTTGVGPVLALVAFLLTTLSLLSAATHNSARFDQLFSTLLVLNGLGLVTLGALIAKNLAGLIAQVKRRAPASRLTVRMVTMFVVLAVTPVVVVYYFSIQFLHRGIDSWFDVRVEQALDDALELSRTSLGVRMRELFKQTELIAGDLDVVSGEATPVALDDARFLSGASELTLIASNGRIISSSNEDPTSILPSSPDDAILLHVRQAQSYIGLDPIGATGLHVRVVVQVPGSPPDASRMLQALFPVPERMNTLAESVQGVYAKYRELVYLRKPLKMSFTLTLSLVLLLSLFTAVWAAFYSARRMVAPLRDLVQGTQAVADGDYETRLPPAGKNELGFLVDSFNDMTRKLARARDETRQGQQQLEDQRTYLETVLSHLSSGVITLDHAGLLSTANVAAEQILGVGLDREVGATLTAIGERHPILRGLTDRVGQHIAGGSHDWREEVVLAGATGRQVLTCRGARLPASDSPVPGYVIVFDDVTALIQAQRDAAWSEVARRLAHEIKNPLTPIQLSAERLRHKYLQRMAAPESDVLDRLTRTIVQQVEAMKKMVNAFSEYARSPQVKVQSVDLNALVTDVAELYRTSKVIDLDLQEALPALDVDADRLRQALHNLIKNALEANAGESGARVLLITRQAADGDSGFIDLEICDEGSGFPPHIIERVFEPYVTTKPKGTGLGLAIVKKIAEEHGGTVRATNDGPHGASVLMRFPVPRPRASRETRAAQHEEAI